MDIILLLLTLTIIGAMFLPAYFTIKVVGSKRNRKAIVLSVYLFTWIWIPFMLGFTYPQQQQLGPLIGITMISFFAISVLGFVPMLATVVVWLLEKPVSR